MEINRSLLKLKMKNLPLNKVEERLSLYKHRLDQELKAKGLLFEYHIWVSTDWFCPDGVPGFAVPFYLFNKELWTLHEQKVGRVEGRSEFEILRLMRHELGHVIDNAFGLRKSATRQQLFGSSEMTYPTSYQPLKYSKNFVHYLGDHYAQSHPDEDFAETFAFWLDPKSKSQNLKNRALEKFQLMDLLMRQKVKRRQSQLVNRYRVDSLDRMNQTLGDYYRGLLAQKQHRVNRHLDRLLVATCTQGDDASKMGVDRMISNWGKKNIPDSLKTTSTKAYHFDWALKQIAQRAKVLRLKARSSDFEATLPSLIEESFRYLNQENQLKFYL
ncbi:MAG: putative zinc-binding metallopeptidase [Pseudomonadota bacterium]